jgi:hypothetical protein
MQSLEIAKRRLVLAQERNRSRGWRLTLWSRFVQCRDRYRCLICESATGIQAHHVFRKSTIQIGTFEPGNGITLCKICHSKVHSSFNGSPDLSLPLGSEGGDDQDEAAFLYGLLYDDARARGLNEDDYYFISDAMLELFIRFQGYAHLYESMKAGHISRIRVAHEIWRSMPEIFYEKLAVSLFRP